MLSTAESFLLAAADRARLAGDVPAVTPLHGGEQPLALPCKIPLAPLFPPRFAPTGPLPRLPHTKTSETE